LLVVLLQVGYVASLASKLADTASSEIGEVSRQQQHKTGQTHSTGIDACCAIVEQLP
jgi:hypothetical protein